jgi:5-hydroxyisourate hydrolase-like protein (transthyretin family)
MRVKVNRQLNAGKYHVNFEVGDFTPGCGVHTAINASGQ